MTDERIESVSDAKSTSNKSTGSKSAGNDLLEAPATTHTTPHAMERPPFKTRLWNEIRNHPFGYSVLGIFLVAGPMAAPFLFPQAPPAAAVVGGLAFAVYAAVSAVPQKFL